MPASISPGHGKTVVTKQTTNSKGFDYDMPSAVPHSLVHGTTWELWCRFGCQRSTFVNLVTMIERHGVDFNGAFIEKRAVCKECGGRLKIAQGIHLTQLQSCGELGRLVTTDGSNFRRPIFGNGIGGPAF